MIKETTTGLGPEQVLQRAKEFFAGTDSLSPANLVDESDRHVTFATFRSRLAISAWRDEETGETRVRVSTLRRHDAVGKFLSSITALEPTA